MDLKRSFIHCNEPFSDSICVCVVMHHIETATIHPNQEDTSYLFLILHLAIWSYHVPSFIGHSHSHSQLPGALIKGNAVTDELLAIWSLFLRYHSASNIIFY